MSIEHSILVDVGLLRRLDRLQLVARRSYGMVSSGSRRSRKFGSSVEFADYRNYSPGDDIRHLDWNIFARSDRLFIKLHEAEEHLAVHILLDASGSMDWGRTNKFHYARQLAACLGYIALNQQDVLSAGLLSDTLTDYFPPAQGKPQVLRYFEFLERAEPAGTTGLAHALRAYAARNTHRGLMLLISDLLTPDAYRAISSVLETGNELVVLHLLDRQEANPSLNGELRLVDSETGEAITLTVDEAVLHQYRQHFYNWADQMESFCLRRNARYVRIETSWPLEEVIFGRLVPRRIVA